MFQKITEVVLANGEKVRLESEQARHEGHLGFFKPNDDYLIEAVINNQQGLTLYLWLRQDKTFRVFGVLNVNRHHTSDDKHDMMLINIDGRCDDGLARIAQKNISEVLQQLPKPPIIFAGQASAAISSHLAVP